MKPCRKLPENRSAWMVLLLLVVMATASGCGKAMPTSPLVDPAGQASQDPSVGSTSMMDGGGDESVLGGGNPVVSTDPAPEVAPQVIGGSPGAGHGKGHHKHKH